MSKTKPLNGVVEAGQASAPQTHDEVVDEAIRRFAPFVFTVTTDFKDNVDFQPLLDLVAREPGVAENFFSIDRSDVVNWFSGLTPEQVLPQYQNALTEVKANTAFLAEASPDVTNAQSALVACCVKQRIVSFAVARENARRAEIAAAQQAHLELVEKYVEEGLTEADAEKAAVAEEEAAKAAERTEDDEVVEDVRTQAFVCLKGYPLSALDVFSLQKQNVQLDSVLTINSLAKLGIRKDDSKLAGGAAAAAAAQQGAKKAPVPEPKKADPKKGGGKKGEETGGSVSVSESVSASIKKELLKMNAFEGEHTFSNVELWEFVAPCAEVPSKDEEKAYELQMSEGEIFGKAVQRIVELEKLLSEYRAWKETKKLKVVPPLITAAAKEESEAAAAALAKEKAEAVAKSAGAKKAPAPPPKGKGVEVVEHQAAKEELVPNPATPLPPLPHSMEEFGVDQCQHNQSFFYLQNRVRNGERNVFFDAFMEATLTQAEHSIAAEANAAPIAKERDSNGNSPHATPRSPPVQDPHEVVLRQVREDAADFTDYMFAVLDGNQQHVFESLRQKRLQAFEAEHHLVRPRRVEDPSETVVAIGSHEYRVAPHYSSASSYVMPRFVETIIAPHRRRRLQAQSSDELPSNFMKVAKEILVSEFGFTDAQASSTIMSRRILELLTPSELETRLLSLHRANDLVDPSGTSIAEVGAEGTCIVQCVRVPEDRHRTAASWAAFHGMVTYPQFVQWKDFVSRELLHYYPPPRDEDEEDAIAEANDGSPEPDEEEEEEEDDGEVEYDADGEPIEKPKKKKEKKVILYDIEYYNAAAERQEALRRRRMLEHFQRLVAPSEQQNVEELLLANNHTAHLVYQETEFMYPADGCIIACEKSLANADDVHCNVYSDASGSAEDFFGFRATRTEASVDCSAKSGVRCIVSSRGAVLSLESTVEDAEAVAAAAFVQQQQQQGSGEATSPVAQSPAASPHPTGKTPRGGKDAVGPTVPQAVTPSESARQSDQPKVQIARAAKPCTSVTLTLPSGTTVTLDSTSDAVHLLPEKSIAFGSVAEFSFVHVFNPATQAVQRILVNGELRRSVLPSGAVQVTYFIGVSGKTDNSAVTSANPLEEVTVQLFPDGSSAAIYRNALLRTNADGSRLVRDSLNGATVVVTGFESTVTRDDHNFCVATLREDGVMMVAFDDGRRVIRFADGTVFAHHQKVSVVSLKHIVDIHSPFPYPNVTCRTVDLVIHGGDVALVVKPKDHVQLFSFTSGLAADFSLGGNVLSVRPHASKHQSLHYVLDTFYGGLRVEDDVRTYHVTPFGRCRTRLASEEYAPVPTDLTVKHRVEAFVTEPEVLSRKFWHLSGACGAHDCHEVAHHHAIHVLARPPQAAQHTDGRSILPFGEAHRTRSEENRQLQVAEKIKKLLATDSASISQVPPSVVRIIFRLVDGRGVELVQDRYQQRFIDDILEHADLVHSDVIEKPLMAPFKALAVVVTRKGDASLMDNFPPYLLNNVSSRALTQESSRTIDHFKFLVQPTLGLKYLVPPEKSTGAARTFGSVVVRRFVRVEDASHFDANVLDSNLIGHFFDAVEPQSSIQSMKAHVPVSTRVREQGGRDKCNKDLKASTSVLFPTRSIIGNNVDALHQQVEKLRSSNAQYWAQTNDSAALLQKLAVENQKYIPRSREAGGKKESTTPRLVGPKLATPPPPEVRQSAPAPAVAQPPQHQQHANPAGSGGKFSQKFQQVRIVATPNEVDLGSIMEGFRYSATFQLTNIATVACRFRVTAPQNANWLTIDHPRLPIAAGMSVRVSIEVDGYQPVGSVTVECTVTHEGGMFAVPIIINTRGSEERPVSQHRNGVRMIGPSKMKYIPTASSTVTRPQEDGNVSD